MKRRITLYLILISFCTLSQRKYAKEFSFINDNDLYISSVQDRYYTNGMFFRYRYLKSHTTKKIVKKIFQLQLGHHIYSPFISTVPDISLHDRPFAGYLYGSFGFENFYKKNDVLKISGQIGVIGPSAFGEEMMEVVHNIYGLSNAVGWKYQIAEAFALNFESTYVKPIWMDNTTLFDINWFNNARVGSVFTDATTGIYARVGFIPLQKLINSIAFGSNLNTNLTPYNNEVEAYFYIKPTVSLVLYDATIQGSFLNDKSPVTYQIKNVKFTGEFGFRFTANRFNLGYSVIFHSKKLKSLNVPDTNFYGRIVINYQFN